MSDDIVTRLRAIIPVPLEFADEGAPAHPIAKAIEEIERLRNAYKDLFRLANHAYCFNNFKVLQDNMKEHQQTASELGLHP